MIARWPGVTPKAKRTDALVQYADVVPTLIEAAGGEVDAAKLDGTSFLGVLRGQTETHRQYVYGTHNNVPEGPSFPIRTISDGTYRYIRNLTPEKLYIEKHLMGINGKGELNNMYWQSWIFESWQSPRTYDLVQRYMHRPAEEVYHTASDHYEMENLAGSPAVAEIQKRLSDELDRWMKSQGDPGAEQDTTESLQAAKMGQHRFRPASK